MKISFSKSKVDKIKAGAFLFFCFESDAAVKKKLNQIESLLNVKFPKESIEDFKGKDTETDIIYAGGKRIIVSGLGKKDKFDLEKIRKAVSRAVKKSGYLSISSLAIEVPTELVNGYSVEDFVVAQAESAVMRLYRFDKYYTKKDYEKIDLKEIIFFSANGNGNAATIEKAARTGQILGEATNIARDLGNEPSNVAHPDYVAKYIQRDGKKNGYNVKVLNKKDLERIKAGCMLGVAQGSVHEPKFVIMEYKGGSPKDKPVALVGKGVTFDSGGISIKPSAGMDAMKMDMCGAGAVIGAFNALSRLKLKVNVVGFIPLVENMPGGNAYRPGDILKAYNGMNVEIQNTDAEGRLILADALSYSLKYKPKCIIDLATLTGAAIIALGTIATIAVANDDKLVKKLEKAGEKTHERVWQLPSWEDYDRLIDSDVADVTNVGKGRQAGSIVAGMFLKRFVDDYPWVHLDIAGTAMNNSPTEYVPSHATGVGVRLLIEFLKS